MSEQAELLAALREVNRRGVEAMFRQAEREAEAILRWREKQNAPGEPRAQ